MGNSMTTLTGMLKEMYSDDLTQFFNFIDYSETDEKVTVTYSPMLILKARESLVVDLIEWHK